VKNTAQRPVSARQNRKLARRALGHWWLTGGSREELGEAAYWHDGDRGVLGAGARRLGVGQGALGDAARGH